MRPTWHFLVPADIRWVLALTSHRVQRLNATYYRKTGLDASTWPGRPMSWPGPSRAGIT